MTSARPSPRWSAEPIQDSAAQHQAPTLPPNANTLCSLEKFVFVGEVAIVVVLGGRKMPTFPVF